MGSLLPAGSVMKYFRTVKVASDATENRRQEDEFDEMNDYIRGGIDLPLPAALADVDDGAFVDDDIEDDIDLDAEETETDEVFDIDEAMKIEVEDDDL